MVSFRNTASVKAFRAFDFLRRELKILKNGEKRGKIMWVKMTRSKREPLKNLVFSRGLAEEVGFEPTYPCG
jgi:hypothetical protein